MFAKLAKVFVDFINNLDSSIKTVVILILIIISAMLMFKGYIVSTIRDYAELMKEEKCLSEEYTKMITPYVNERINEILIKDKDATNVLLLNYHNTMVSSNGLSYRYLTSLTERKRGFDTRSCLRVWKELEYINYGEEIEKINLNGSLQINDLKDYERSLPNLVELLRISYATSAGLYPLLGVDGSIGMIIVIYHNNKEYKNNYYLNVIAPSIQPLISLLDYNSAKDAFKKMHKNGKVEILNLIK